MQVRLHELFQIEFNQVKRGATPSQRHQMTLDKMTFALFFFPWYIFKKKKNVLIINAVRIKTRDLCIDYKENEEE
jgi:hypothetical protein